MGTNYYLVCKVCGSRIHHIGKQSAGWPFTSDWSEETVKKWLENPNMQIEDEYGEKYSWKEFREKITREWCIRAPVSYPCPEEEEFLWC